MQPHAAPCSMMYACTSQYLTCTIWSETPSLSHHTSCTNHDPCCMWLRHQSTKPLRVMSKLAACSWSLEWVECKGKGRAGSDLRLQIELWTRLPTNNNTRTYPSSNGMMGAIGVAASPVALSVRPAATAVIAATPAVCAGVRGSLLVPPIPLLLLMSPTTTRSRSAAMCCSIASLVGACSGSNPIICSSADRYVHTSCSRASRSLAPALTAACSASCCSCSCSACSSSAVYGLGLMWGAAQGVVAGMWYDARVCVWRGGAVVQWWRWTKMSSEDEPKAAPHPAAHRSCLSAVSWFFDVSPRRQCWWILHPLLLAQVEACPCSSCASAFEFERCEMRALRNAPRRHELRAPPQILPRPRGYCANVNIGCVSFPRSPAPNEWSQRRQKWWGLGGVMALLLVVVCAIEWSQFNLCTSLIAFAGQVTAEERRWERRGRKVVSPYYRTDWWAALLYGSQSWLTRNPSYLSLRVARMVESLTHASAGLYVAACWQICSTHDADRWVELTWGGCRKGRKETIVYSVAPEQIRVAVSEKKIRYVKVLQKKVFPLANHQDCWTIIQQSEPLIIFASMVLILSLCSSSSSSAS